MPGVSFVWWQRGSVDILDYGFGNEVDILRKGIFDTWVGICNYIPWFTCDAIIHPCQNLLSLQLGQDIDMDDQLDVIHNSMPFAEQ